MGSYPQARPPVDGSRYAANMLVCPVCESQLKDWEYTAHFRLCTIILLSEEPQDTLLPGERDEKPRGWRWRDPDPDPSP
jgi:hypothetical protein